MSLMSALIKEIDRNEALIKEYERLPDGSGQIGAALMRHDIDTAKKAMGDGDVVEMLLAYKALKGNTG